MDPLRHLAEALRKVRGGRELCVPLHQALAPIREYDVRTGSDLGRTLKVYFESGGNLAATAWQLFLHRNSVLYRLQRIEELSGIDARDRRTRLLLLVAFALADPSLLEQTPSKGEET